MINKSDWIKFNRHELAGSFGDIGTDLPLLIAMIGAAKLDITSTFVMFGLMQILTGLMYGLPMPMQPLKAMAVIIIAQKLPANIIYGAGFSIGILMLILTTSGLLNFMVKKTPLHVVRGIQFGLGLSLVSLALKNYIPSLGLNGYILAAICFSITIVLWNNKKYPAVLINIIIGILFSIYQNNAGVIDSNLISFQLPKFNIPDWADIWTGFFILAIPQIPLSISNSVIATHRTLQDLYPERKVSVKKIGFTFSIINLVSPFFSGPPTCHGCGGLAGHYAFGARTGGSVIIYGSMYIILGSFFSSTIHEVLQFFPGPLLGVILFFEALVLLKLIRDISNNKTELTIALIVASVAFTLPQGFFVAMVLGVLLTLFINKFKNGSI
jgi:hypothetical protein